MGQALYRKYRSKSLKDVVGQEHVTTTLEQAIKQKRISHAYLFTGPRGVGKTSVARILAHEINELPYTDDTSHIDIIEIDAASNRRIDEIRELRDKVHIAPTSAHYKVYIIDEVHMLTREAFNALLKTLEEPPRHVIFILATTDAQKLPETIISRTQRFHFKPAETEDLIKLLNKVAKAEKIAISQEATTLLALHSDGSFRDSLSLLDQARSYGPSVNVDTIQQLLGLPPAEALQTLFKSLKTGDLGELVRTLGELYNQGYQAATLAKELAELIRSDIVSGKAEIDHTSSLELLGKLIEVPAAYDPERYLEIILLQSKPATSKQSLATPISEQVDTITVEIPKPIISKPSQEAAKKGSPKPVSNDELWSALLQALKQKHNTLHGIVRMAKPSFSDKDTLQLTFTFPFHQKRLNEAANRQLLLDTIEELTSKKLKVEFVLDSASPKTPKDPQASAASPPDDSLSAISNIFNGAELLES